MVRNCLKEQLAEKIGREKRSISLRQMARESGVSVWTLSRFSRGIMAEYPADVLAKLCAYFNCGVGDLLRYEMN